MQPRPPRWRRSRQPSWASCARGIRVSGLPSSTSWSAGAASPILRALCIQMGVLTHACHGNFLCITQVIILTAACNSIFTELHCDAVARREHSIRARQSIVYRLAEQLHQEEQLKERESQKAEALQRQCQIEEAERIRRANRAMQRAESARQRRLQKVLILRIPSMQQRHQSCLMLIHTGEEP